MDVVSPKREQNSAPASPSHTAPDRDSYFWRMQQPQARKVQTMYAGSAQRLRDEASQRGASQPEHNPSNQGAFGSPTPVPFHANGTAAMAGKRSPFHNHPFQAGTAPSHAHVTRAAPGGGKQPATSTAQLTIFYAGVVNVYDDVPFDKAQAIMLLAGSGNTWSGSNYMNPPVAAPGRNNPFLKTPMAVPSQSTPAPPAPPPRPGVVFSNNIRPPPTTNVELPQARKASLARFLEKRKDRVRKVPEGEAAAPGGSRDKSPDRPVSKPATSRSPSPSPAPAAGRRDPPTASCSEAGPCSPPTKPPGTPPRQNGMQLESEKRSPKRRDTNNGTTIAKDDYTNVLQQCSKRARNGRSPHRILDSLL